ncbi:hypothetical protein DDZ18_06620 [Marinicauda salina]|uniref:Toxin n=1 Tax=Marinicauda salina TaxID=2135793 RepID=A0A2U2BTM5_9PROT|nr:type II toxin-antitoxin system RelE/ParE family toxin [Marinicauda salina]PWE17353.1 hypothetical protein DDZ18_06620 [Marinicauda salina]
MPELRLRPLARRDLTDIWRYAADRWSEDQADRYLRTLNETLLSLLEFPERGRSLESVRATYRMVRAESHLVIYRPLGQAIEVVRILHMRMDPERHL